MCPYIACFSVNLKYWLETSHEWTCWWAVSFEQEIIVFEPVREWVMVNHSPSCFPYLSNKFFCLLSAFCWYWQYIHSISILKSLLIIGMIRILQQTSRLCMGLVSKSSNNHAQSSVHAIGRVITACKGKAKQVISNKAKTHNLLRSPLLLLTENI